MLDGGGTNPKNYDWKKKGNRVMCFNKDGYLIFSIELPKTMREALLLGYLEGWAYGDQINQNYIEMLEGLAAERMPKPMTFEEAEMDALMEVFEREPLGPEDYE